MLNVGAVIVPITKTMMMTMIILTAKGRVCMACSYSH